MRSAISSTAPDSIRSMLHQMPASGPVLPVYTGESLPEICHTHDTSNGSSRRSISGRGPAERARQPDGGRIVQRPQGPSQERLEMRKLLNGNGSPILSTDASSNPNLPSLANALEKARAKTDLMFFKKKSPPVTGQNSSECIIHEKGDIVRRWMLS